MSTIKALQHIYTRVEREQSPHKLAGFQTLFYTISELKEAESDEIERRLPYYRADIEPVKRIFFTTSSDKYIVTQIVPLTATDSAGRKGLYLAHSLVFSSEQFSKVGSNIFQIFHDFPFFTTMEETVKHGDFNTGNIPPVSVQIYDNSNQEVKAASEWPSQELKQLVLLALQAQSLACDNRAVVIIGDPKKVESTLRAAFFGVPVQLRKYCTFDTYFHKCNFVATYYWAIGLLETPDNPIFITVDTLARHISTETPVTPETIYEQWVISVIDNQNLHEITSNKDFAFEVCQWLENRPYDVTTLKNSPPEILKSLFKLASEPVKSKLLEQVNNVLPSLLVQRIWQTLFQDLDKKDFLWQLHDGFQISQLLDVLNDVYMQQNYKKPDYKEVRAIGEVLQQSGHKILQIIHALWSEQYTKLCTLLKKLTEDEYYNFAKSILNDNLVDDPFSLLVPGKAKIFINLYFSRIWIRALDWITLVKTLMNIGEFKSFEHLIPYIQKCPEKELKKIEKLMHNNNAIPELFKKELHEIMASIPKRKGISNFLKSLLGRRPEE